MNSSSTRTFAAIAGGAMVTVGIVVTTIAQAAPGAAADSEMLTGTTSTVTTAPSTPPIPLAEPSIKGPAPLPVEMQGLPG
ncbi:hypothetical protein TUM20985_10780 [Mycobacterium antarcticum]|uniref:hypothetical protein n=1 Tax=unclassified Mycolicibacterium TaxID=2636767 RepID=UPI00239289E6|nr:MULTISPECIES: hypothetical protein [unclassified Mycolicibacterium]BDX30531.1 hypothetical protein TUM20985_10780 [Mycolicibacterium sp. TUM20985]GLP79655.1 hypothetical protein TUM20984_10750 [Mycolicibacterium sp. TUM20984]